MRILCFFAALCAMGGALLPFITAPPNYLGGALLFLASVWAFADSWRRRT